MENGCGGNGSLEVSANEPQYRYHEANRPGLHANDDAFSLWRRNADRLFSAKLNRPGRRYVYPLWVACDPTNFATLPSLLSGTSER